MTTSISNSLHTSYHRIPVRLRRLKKICSMISVSRYLEVGVSHGKTFNALDIPFKDAVDPKFKFDTVAQTRPGVNFHEVASDDFFSKLDRSVKYDLIFLDGLHTFEQTYRDFCNCLQHIHEGSVIVIDDTFPNDVFSSIPNQRLCTELRDSFGVPGVAWHGDVYKTIFAIHDYHPGFNYRTIIGSGNIQTILWQSKCGWRSPSFKSLEEISRLTYIELLRFQSLMEPCQEGVALSLCLSEIINYGGIKILS
jgi:hypothetical protein